MNVAALAEALWWLLRTRLRLRRWRGPALKSLLDEVEGAAAPHGDPVALARAMQRASRLVPRTHCFARAIALVRALRRRGHPARLVLGVARDGAGTRAHAWVVLGEHALAEDPSALARYLPLSAPPAHPAWVG